MIWLYAWVTILGMRVGMLMDFMVFMERRKITARVLFEERIMLVKYMVMMCYILRVLSYLDLFIYIYIFLYSCAA